MKKQYLISIISILALCLFSITVVDAYVASSSNYRIEADSLNFGGSLSTSSNYSLQDTLGDIGSGTSTGSIFNLSAGYQSMQVDTYVSVTSPTDLSLSPTINGVAGGASTGSTTWTVTTNNFDGYTMSVKASTSPALTSGSNSFADYVPSYTDPDFTWNVPSGTSYFGFSPEGDEIISRYKDDGSSCNSGSLDTADKCWDGFSTTAKTVSSRSSNNLPSGSETKIKFQAEVDELKIQQMGTYEAEIIVTVLAL